MLKLFEFGSHGLDMLQACTGTYSSKVSSLNCASHMVHTVHNLHRNIQQGIDYAIYARHLQKYIRHLGGSRQFPKRGKCSAAETVVRGLARSCFVGHLFFNIEYLHNCTCAATFNLVLA